MPSSGALAGIVIAVLLLLALAGAALYVRHRRLSSSAAASSSYPFARTKSRMQTRGIVSDEPPPSPAPHPAFRITPYGSPEGEGPRFIHNPGTDMRIATLGPGGAWGFSAPVRGPLTPTSASLLQDEVDPFARSPSSTTLNFPPTSSDDPHTPSSVGRKKGAHMYGLSSASNSAVWETESYLEPPPPAYRRERDPHV